jgi:hypothetical protein
VDSLIYFSDARAGLQILKNKLFTGPVGIPGQEDINGTIPVSVELHQNYPNPFNPTTTIRFGLPEDSNVTLKIFNSRGQLIRTLTNRVFLAGEYRVVWDSTNDFGQQVASGVYIYQLKAGNFSSAKKMLLLQ